MKFLGSASDPTAVGICVVSNGGKILSVSLSFSPSLSPPFSLLPYYSTFQTNTYIFRMKEIR